ncbi:MAG: Cohesin domain protein [Chloroflexi bacterium ADurb.Bin120]|jgi:hypothetical protein|uniref:Cohesin domain-containing protein n=1 Tax=Candidatus Brevifilum fermentans TaxID=1986204 RepID=A0A1Y6K4R3_9CHLR|nr:cohesin domain-containing protein [Brevefilum fermentans]MDI9566481.1 cohesin domain-containing protein [Chloroflexota bacterium]OQB83711.1 MAG: Cohesin domain protein [Chloroflexi bacterium ADurb.Bin120]SMX54671.1 exported protein of unknown function [Brevefilum fermentans]
MKIINLRSVLLVIILLGLVFAPQEPVLAQVAKAGVFEDIKVQPGAQFELPVEVRGVENLYAVDIEIRFDPAILQAEDADPNMEGVQAGLSTFLEAGLLLYNTIDNQEGVLRFAMSQVNPAEPVSGDGILLVVYFLARAEGKTELEISFLEASDRYGVEVVLEPEDGLVTVSQGAPIINATSIPTQDPGSVILIPTLAPTEIPTQAPTEIPTEPPDEGEAEIAMAYPESKPEVYTAYPESQPVEPPTTVAAEVEEGAAQASRSILDYWWAVLIVVLVAGGLAVYLWLSKKRAVG